MKMILSLAPLCTLCALYALAPDVFAGGALSLASSSPSVASEETCVCRFNPSRGLYEQFCFIFGPEGDVEYPRWTGQPCAAE